MPVTTLATMHAAKGLEWSRVFIVGASEDLLPFPNTPEDESQEEWCFAYGEKEWLEGKLFSDLRNKAIGSLDSPAIGRVHCNTGAGI